MSEQHTNEELEARLAKLRAANEAATGWGAAVGARHEEIQGIESELRRRAVQRPYPAGGPTRDLVARLRWPEGLPSPKDHPVSVALRVEAADEIEELRRNLRHWREECGKLHAKLSQPATVAQRPTDSDKLAYTSTGQIAACKCGSFPRLYGDGAWPDDGYRSLWCQTCMEHVTSMMPSEREVIDHWNALREQEHAGEASSIPSTNQSAPVLTATHNSGEGDPSVTLDCAGADTSLTSTQSHGGTK
jgi:hypothetical protein